MQHPHPVDVTSQRVAGDGLRLLVMVLALAVGAVALLALAWLLISTLDPQARVAREAAIYRQQQLDAQLDSVDIVVAAGWRLLPLIAVAGLVLMGLLVLYRRWATHDYIKAYHLTRALEAQQPHVPQQLTYSPHYAPHVRAHQEDTPVALDAPPAALPHSVPTFAQLLIQSKVGQGNPLLLGYDVENSQPLIGSWLDLYSTAVSGMPGSGKTTSQRFLACQTALHGAKFAICDPHAGAAEDSLGATLAPLNASFLCAPASSDRAILEVVRYIADVGRRRVIGQDRDTTPIMLWIDELTALLGRSSIGDELAALLEQVAQEYRKRAVFVCASGQIWTAERTTSELRDSFASVLCHRMKRNQARLLLPTYEAAQVERLPVGQAVLWRTSGDTTTVQIPLTTAADVGRVAGLLATTRPPGMPTISQNEVSPMPVDMPTDSQAMATAGMATSASGSDGAIPAEARRAAALFLDGRDPAAIVLELRGIKSSEGKRYQMALAEVLGLIRMGVRV